MFRMITGTESPTRAPSASATPSSSPTSSSPRHTRRIADRLAGDLRRLELILIGNATVNSARASHASASPGRTSRRSWATSRAANATACTSPACSAAGRTSSSSTSRPTTWTSTPCVPWRSRWRASPAAPVIINHDRWFLDRVATHILAFEGDSQVLWHGGLLILRTR